MPRGRSPSPERRAIHQARQRGSTLNLIGSLRDNLGAAKLSARSTKAQEAARLELEKAVARGVRSFGPEPEPELDPESQENTALAVHRGLPETPSPEIEDVPPLNTRHQGFADERRALQSREVGSGQHSALRLRPLFNGSDEARGTFDVHTADEKELCADIVGLPSPTALPGAITQDDENPVSSCSGSTGGASPVEAEYPDLSEFLPSSSGADTEEP